MAEAICNNHGKVEAIWKEGTSKAGKNYAFWACPVKGKDPATGEWWRCKVEVANTPSGKFEQSLDKAGAQMDTQNKEKTITRLALAKSWIESGNQFNEQALEQWLAWVENRQTKPF